MPQLRGGLVLKETPWTVFRKELLIHYSRNRGAVGRTLFYGIYLGYHRVGEIGVSSTTMPMKGVLKEVYGVERMTPELKVQYSNEIACNTIFRLNETQPNLASRILSKFTKMVQVDYYKKYDVWLRGIISLTFGENERGTERTGISYKAANWKYLGLSSGGKKTWSDGHYVYKRVKSKHVWIWTYRPRHERKPPPDDLVFSVSSDDTESPTVEKGAV